MTSKIKAFSFLLTLIHHKNIRLSSNYLPANYQCDGQVIGRRPDILVVDKSQREAKLLMSQSLEMLE